MPSNEKETKTIDDMISEMVLKLGFVNQEVIKPESFSEAQYDELFEMYEWVMGKETISVKEKEAILSELKNLRK